jgi:hypothetical protein
MRRPRSRCTATGLLDERAGLNRRGLRAQLLRDRARQQAVATRLGTAIGHPGAGLTAAYFNVRLLASHDIPCPCVRA